MQTVIGVRFKKAGKIYYFSPGNLAIEKGDHVIVETARGIEYGTAVIGPREVADEDVVLPLKVVHRKATEADAQKVEENHKREKEAFAICEQKIAAHHLEMKLVDVEYTFDVNKIVFYFTADGRVDFRELVKDLASVFRTRIELRQIGVRDEAKLMGGIGCCGRPLCCASFLGDFEPVSIRMAKEQNLSLNPTKISGICGRLMCCLKYESNCYCGGNCPKKAAVQEPQQGSIVATTEGDGKVISLNGQRHTATILLLTGRTIVAPWGDIVEKDPEEAAEELASLHALEEKERTGERQGSRRRQPHARPAGQEKREAHASDGTENRERKSRRRRSRRPREGNEPREGQKKREAQPRGEGEERQTHRRRRPRRDRQPRGGQDGEAEE